MNAGFRFHAVLCLALALLLARTPGRSAAGETTDEDSILTFGYSTRMIQEVDPNDARAAIQVWVKAVIGRVGETVESRAIIVTDPASIEVLLKNKVLDMLVMAPEDYIQIQRENPDLRPLWVAATRGKTAIQFGIVVRRGAGISSLDQLKGRKLALEANSMDQTPGMWLKVLLARNGLGQPGAFFSEIRKTPKVSQAVLSVFFRQADACLVPLETVETMSELNPQLKNDLAVLATSPEFLRYIVCIRTDVYQRYGAQLKEAIKSVNTDATGRHLLGLFHVDQLVAYEPSTMEKNLSLLREYEALQAGRSPGRGAQRPGGGGR